MAVVIDNILHHKCYTYTVLMYEHTSLKPNSSLSHPLKRTVCLMTVTCIKSALSFMQAKFLQYDYYIGLIGFNYDSALYSLHSPLHWVGEHSSQSPILRVRTCSSNYTDYCILSGAHLTPGWRGGNVDNMPCSRTQVFNNLLSIRFVNSNFRYGTWRIWSAPRRWSDIREAWPVWPSREGACFQEPLTAQ